MKEQDKPIAVPQGTSLKWRVLLPLALLVLLAGLAMRAWMVDLGTRHGYLYDHIANVDWGVTANEKGLLGMYSLSAQELAEIRVNVHRDGVAREIATSTPIAPNHPPLTMAMYAAQAKLLGWVQAPIVANTFTARAVMAIVPTLFDALTAVAAMLLAWQVFGRRAGLIAAAAVWLLPPVAMNSAFWGQVDSLFLAPTLVMLLLAIRGRWMYAGLCMGIALLLKPQGLLLAPIALYAVAALGPAGSTTDVKTIARRLAPFVLAAAGAFFLLSLPWTIADGTRWIDNCYVKNLTEAYPETTLKAFNLWYLDLLRLDKQTVFASDSTASILGVSKDLLGRLLLLVAMAAGAALCWRKFKRQPVGLLVFAGLFLLATFILPTRVHERYIVYCLPVLVVLAAGARKYWPVLLALTLVAVAEHSVNTWMGDAPPAGTLMSKRMAKAHYDAFGQIPLEALPGGRRPSYDEVVQEYANQAHRGLPDYRQSRAKIEFYEYAFTLLSLASFAMLWWLIGRREQPATSSVKAPPRRGHKLRR